MAIELDLDFDLQQRLEQEAEWRELTLSECIQQLLAEHLPLRCDPALKDYQFQGVRYSLVRLNDAQFYALRQQSVPIEVDGMFQLLLLYPLEAARTVPQLGELYSALRVLLGESGTLYDE